MLIEHHCLMLPPLTLDILRDVQFTTIILQTMIVLSQSFELIAEYPSQSSAGELYTSLPYALSRTRPEISSVVNLHVRPFVRHTHPPSFSTSASAELGDRHPLLPQTL